ncbi:MAG: glycosyltransferase family 4 protein [Pararhodobacter sp.]|nr:glycosyltransferase family 4 protein [Pararhodobacter sp.]
MSTSENGTKAGRMAQADAVAQAVVLAPGQAGQIAEHLGTGAGRPLRLAFVAGPGDAAGTFAQWVGGRHDERVPVLTYSAQFYTLVQALGAQALVAVEQGADTAPAHPSIQLVSLPRNRAARRLGWHLAERDYARRLAALMRDWRPDAVILGDDLKPAAYHALARHTRVFLTLHNSFWPMGRRPQGWRAGLKLSALGRGLAQASGAVCTSAECARQLQALAGRIGPVEVEMPQLLTAQLRPLRQRERARDLLYLGRIEAEKGVFDLLDAFGACVARHPDARLVLAGAGGAVPALQAAIADHPAAAQIRYAGQLDAQGVHQALATADLLVCPTRSAFREGLALVVLEAAAQGVPALASSVVPAAETAGDACATFPADDRAALETALARLMDDDAAFAGLAGAAGAIRPRMTDRRLGWGSCLARVLAGQDEPGAGAIGTGAARPGALRAGRV